MKSLLLISLIGLMFFSCKKAVEHNIPASIDGSWKMTVVKDNATNALLAKPSSIAGDVIITFVPDSDTTGTFSGNTPSNVFTGFGVWSNTYSLGHDQAISIPNLSMTKVGETTWGAHFVDNIRDARHYSFEAGGRLNIKTTKKTLIFTKL